MAGTVAVLARLREVLADADTVLDDEHGISAAAAPLGALGDEAGHVADRLGDIGAATRRPVTLARRAARDRPWAAFAARRRATRPRGNGDAS